MDSRIKPWERQAPRKNVTLSNVGNATLTITSLSITGPDSSNFVQINSCPPALSAGANCVISVSFAPVSAGSRTASVTIQDDATGSPQAISLAGTALSAAATIFPATIAFPGQLVGTASPAAAVTVRNSGDGVLVLSRISFGGANPPISPRQTTAARMSAAAPPAP